MLMYKRIIRFCSLTTEIMNLFKISELQVNKSLFIRRFLIDVFLFFYLFICTR